MPGEKNLPDEIELLLEQTGNGGDLTLIFEELGKESMSMAPAEMSYVIEMGKLWWAQREPEVRSIVCKNSQIQNIVDGDLKEVTQNVAELLACKFGVPLAAKMGLIVARAGLRTWCKTEWGVRENV